MLKKEGVAKGHCGSGAAHGGGGFSPNSRPLTVTLRLRDNSVVSQPEASPQERSSYFHGVSLVHPPALLTLIKQVTHK